MKFYVKEYIDSVINLLQKSILNKFYNKTEVDNKIDTTKDDLNTKISNTESDLSNKIDNIEDNLNTKVENSTTNINDQINKVRTEIEKEIPDPVDVTKFLEKETYDTDKDGVIDKAKTANKVEGIEETTFFSVYGKSPTGEEGFYEFPIGYIDDQTNKFQSVRQNVKTNEVYTISLIKPNKLNDLIIQCYEFTKGSQNIVSTLKKFNNSDASNFYYDKEYLEFTDNGAKIKDSYDIKSVKNENTGYYELDLSNEGFISEIEETTMNEIKVLD